MYVDIVISNRFNLNKHFFFFLFFSFFNPDTSYNFPNIYHYIKFLFRKRGICHINHDPDI